MNKHTANPRGKQRGVALMMTLGILALLLIMAMSFSDTARTNEMAAGIQADLKQARLMCESGLSRALALISANLEAASRQQAVYPATFLPFFDELDATNAPGQYCFVSQPAGSDDKTDLPDALKAPGILDAIYFALEASDDAEWHHMYQTVVDAGGTDVTELVGRFAYLVLDESGKIDATAAVTPDWEPYYDYDGDGNITQGEYHDINGNGVWDATGVNEGSEVRTGASLAEVTVPADFVNLLPRLAGRDRNSDGHDDSARWFSLQHMVNAGAISAATAGRYLAYAADSDDIEAYTVDEGGGTLTDYHRFDLTGVSWDPVTSSPNTDSGWDDLQSSGMTGLEIVQWLDSNPVAFWVDPDDPSQGETTIPPAAVGATGGLAVLKTLPGLRDSDTNGQAKRYEVLASLVDYNDSNLFPTYGDIDGDGKPDFVGLEYSPYANEVRIEVAYAFRNHPVFGPSGAFDLGCQLELINPYDTPGTNGLPSYYNTVDVEVEVTFNYNGNRPPGPYPGPPAPAPGPPVSETIVWAADSVPVGAHSYEVPTLVLDSGNRNTAWQYNWGPDIDLEITEIQVRVTKPVSGELLDYSRWTGSFVDTISPSPNLIHPQRRYASLQTNDPRCNTRPENWDWTHPNDWRVGAGVGDLGMKNSLVDYSGGDGDMSGGDDPKDLQNAALSVCSTAYMRNAPMKSLWELGAIHRSDPWRTIDLKSFSGGDAVLLSRTKIGPWTRTTGKFNANSPFPAAWARVLSDLDVDDLYFDPDAGSTAPSSVTGTSVAGAAKGYLERGEIADLLVDTGAGNDRERESIVGRLANLLTVRQNYFTVIVVGQAVKDLDTMDPGGDEVREYETGKFCRILAEQKIIATVYRDGLHNTFRIDRIEYMEE